MDRDNQVVFLPMYWKECLFIFPLYLDLSIFVDFFNFYLVTQSFTPDL